MAEKNADSAREAVSEAGLRVRICFPRDLPTWANKDEFDVDASCLVIEDGEYRAIYSSRMEPEDVSFYRDLAWVKTELDRLRTALSAAEAERDAAKKIAHSEAADRQKVAQESIRNGEEDRERIVSLERQLAAAREIVERKGYSSHSHVKAIRDDLEAAIAPSSGEPRTSGERGGT